MRFCKTCNAYIAEPFEKCPLCQNEIINIEYYEEEDFIFPASDSIKKRSRLHRLMNYAILIAAVISLCLDVVIGLHGKEHWSIIVLIWCGFSSLVSALLFVRIRPFGEVVWKLGFWGIIAAALTTWYALAFDVLISLILPIILIVMLCLEFVAVLAEKYSGSMVYFLMVSMASLIFFLICYIYDYKGAILPSISASVAVILTILLVALRSERMLGDIRKKLSL